MRILTKFLKKSRGCDIPMSQAEGSALQLEHCVMCGEVTKVLTDMPIDCRENYIYGCGQLCERCANVLKYEEEKYENSCTDIETEILFEALLKAEKGD